MCLFPQNALLNELGRIQFNHEGSIKIPCGKCSECIAKRSIEWSLRARHEISLHKNNCFLTLTYNKEKLPSIFTVKIEFQKFIKKLRKHTKTKIRYMVSHEYGSKTFRPHHHAIIFGYDPKNQEMLKKTKSGATIFTSTEIQKLWQHGFHSIGQANEKTAYYIASYALKGKKHILTDPITGEITTVNDCMDVSKRPAIGYNYFLKNYQQLIDSDTVLPRYYFKKLETLRPDLYEEYQNKRINTFKTRSSHELYAKFVIDKAQQLKTEFRENEFETEKEHLFRNNELLTTRDEFHRKNQGIK